MQRQPETNRTVGNQDPLLDDLVKRLRERQVQRHKQTRVTIEIVIIKKVPAVARNTQIECTLRSYRSKCCSYQLSLPSVVGELET